MVRRQVFLVFFLLPGQLAANSVPLTKGYTTPSRFDVSDRADMEPEAEEKFISDTGEEEQDEAEDDGEDEDEDDGEESESDGEQPRSQMKLAYVPKPFKTPCDGGEVDFGPHPEEGILKGLSQHMQVALEQTCTNLLLGCAYREGDFDFAGAALSGLFKGAAKMEDHDQKSDEFWDEYWTRFRSQLAEGFNEIHEKQFGIGAEDEDGECPEDMPKNRDRYIKAVQDAWRAHFIGYDVTLLEVWKTMKKSKFDFMVALADQIGDDQKGIYAGILQSKLVQGKFHKP